MASVFSRNAECNIRVAKKYASLTFKDVVIGSVSTTYNAPTFVALNDLSNYVDMQCIMRENEMRRHFQTK